MISLFPPFCRQEPLHRIGQDKRGGSFPFPSLFLAKSNYLSIIILGRAHAYLCYSALILLQTDLIRLSQDRKSVV